MAGLLAFVGVLPLAAALPFYPGVVLRPRDVSLNETAGTSQSHTGVARFAFQQGIPGACGVVHGDGELIVGLHTDLYGSPDAVSPLCGTTVFIASATGTLSAQVADACIGDCGTADDLVVSTQVYDQLGGSRDAGILNVQWKMKGSPAGPPSSPSPGLNPCEKQGVARFGYQSGIAGSCGTVHQDSDLIAAVRQDVMGAVVKCGDHISITNSNGAQLDLLVADIFTAGDANDLVLSTGVYDKLGGSREQGLLHITWSPPSCTPSTPTTTSAQSASTTTTIEHTPSTTDASTTMGAPSDTTEAPSATDRPGPPPTQEPSSTLAAPSPPAPAPSPPSPPPTESPLPPPPAAAPSPPAQSPSPPPAESPSPPPAPAPSPPAPSPPSTGGWQQEALDTHNAFRDRFGVPHLTWDDTLASTGQAWTDQCIWDHSGGPYGENRAIGYATIAAAVTAWNDELSLYSYSNPGYSEATGHFTQDVWKATTKLGCGLTNCPAGAYLTCEYDPAGNVVGPGGDPKYFLDNVPRPLY